MSSVTSTDAVRLKPEPAGARDAHLHAAAPRAAQPAADAEGFRPWHFFVLASLMLATVAVLMSRQSTPENLVLISFTIGAAGAAAAGFYRMLAPLAADDVSIFREPLTERTRTALEREKTLVLRSIKELEFDRAMRKLSDRDFEEMGGRLRARAISLMKQLEAGRAGYRTVIERELQARMNATGRQGTGPVHVSATGPVPLTGCGCGAPNDADAIFCKRCGTRLRRTDAPQ
jgi:hypothetical protein